MYKRINNKIYEENVQRREVNLTELENELSFYKQMTKPTNRELIDLGMSIHPYYMERPQRVQSLTKKIKEIKGVA